MVKMGKRGNLSLLATKSHAVNPMFLFSTGFIKNQLDLSTGMIIALQSTVVLFLCGAVERYDIQKSRQL